MKVGGASAGGRPSPLALAALLSFLACSRDSAATEPAPSADKAPALSSKPKPDSSVSAHELASSADASSASSAPALRASPRMRVSERRGVATLPELSSTIEQPLELRLVRGDSLTLSLDDYVRVHLTGPALVRLLPAGRAALLLREGLVTVDVSPRGVRSTVSAFWLATPAVRVDVADSARLALRAYPDESTELSVVSGYLTLARPGEPVSLRADALVCATLDEAEVGPLGLATLELAEKRLEKTRSCARAPTSGRTLESALAAQLERVSASVLREQAQLAEHDRLLETQDAGALSLRRALALTGAELLALRQGAAALRTQLEAGVLGHAPTEAVARLLSRAGELGVAD